MQTNNDMRKYLKPKEVEELFGIKASTLRRQRWGDYGLPYFKLESQILYSIDELNKLLKRFVPTKIKHD